MCRPLPLVSWSKDNGVSWCSGVGSRWLTRADCDDLSPTLCSLALCRQLEVSHGRCTYSMVIGKYYISRFWWSFFFSSADLTVEPLQAPPLTGL